VASQIDTVVAAVACMASSATIAPATRAAVTSESAMNVLRDIGTLAGRETGGVWAPAPRRDDLVRLERAERLPRSPRRRNVTNGAHLEYPRHLQETSR
jgi:hypothetical protein